MSWHKSGRWLGFHRDSGRETSDVYSLDVTTGKLEQWTFSETGGIDTRQFVDPELIRWKSGDGRMITVQTFGPLASDYQDSQWILQYDKFCSRCARRH